MSDHPRRLKPNNCLILLRDVEPEEPEPLVELARPRVRADCVEVPRPCPFVGCRYNLYLDVSSYGALRSNFTEWDPDGLDPSMCALDHAEQGGLTLEQVGQICNLTRERVRQLEVKASKKLALRSSLSEFADLYEPITGVRRIL